jgi:folate-binding protein YgfZ
MPTALLKDRALILVSGPDAEHFLQNILTTDLDRLEDGQAKPGALLSPQGKILFDFLISRGRENTLRLDCRADVADDFIRRLMLYRLRAKAEIAKQEQSLVSVEWDGDSTASDSDSSCSEIDSTSVVDTRFADAAVRRRYGPPAGDGEGAAWDTLRIAHGVAESGSEYQLGDAFPHDVLLDQTGGVGFQKGCYVGQEVVSRMQHRGTARRRVLLVSADAALPAPGSELTVDGRGVGTLGSTAGNIGLAIARIDRVKTALDEGKPILAGDVPVALSIPAWANFTFPEQAGPEQAGIGEA